MRAHIPDPKAELVVGMTVAQAEELELWRLPEDSPDSFLQLRSAIRIALANYECGR